MTLFRKIVWQFINWSTACFLGVLVVFVFLQVVSRYVFNNPISWTEEMSRFIFIWIIFLGTFLGLRSRDHIRVGSFIDRFSPEIKTMILTVTTCLMFYFSVYLIPAGIGIVRHTYGSRTPVMEISSAFVYIIIPISASLMVAYLLVQFYYLKWRIAALSGIISISIVVAPYLLFGGGRCSGETLTLVSAIYIVILIMAGMPIAFCMGLACTLFFVLSENITTISLPIRLVSGIDSFPLLAVPLFILAGELMNIGGVTARLVNLARGLVGSIRGGLGMAVIVAEYFFSGISGSSTADVSALGSLLIPAMQKAGYRGELAVSIVSAATSMGILVPPCIPMIILGGMTGISVGALFVAGFIPAIVIALCLMVLIYIQAIKLNLPVDARLSFKEIVKAVIDAIIPLLLPVIIFGGILSGAATATEVSAVAVIYAAIIGFFVYKEIKISQIIPMLVRTVIVTGTVLFLVGTSSVFSYVLAINNIPRIIAGWITDFSSSTLVFLFFCNFAFIILGAVLEGLPAMLILTPIFLPFLGQFGVNPLHFGILIIYSMGIGFFLPPIGVGIFIASTFAKLDLGKVIIPFMPYFIALIIGLIIITVFPWFTLFLPNIFFK